MAWADAMEPGFGERVALAARSLVGTPFRPQGCGRSGVDCVGLVLLAMAQAGRELRLEQTYRLRFNARADAEARLREFGFVPVRPADRQIGDIVLAEQAPGQLHFGIVTRAGLVEAHAALRRVVERPWRADDNIVSIWRAE